MEYSNLFEFEKLDVVVKSYLNFFDVDFLIFLREELIRVNNVDRSLGFEVSFCL